MRNAISTDSSLKGEIKALDERLTTEIKGLTARVANQEFTNRGILIACVGCGVWGFTHFQVVNYLIFREKIPKFSPQSLQW